MKVYFKSKCEAKISAIKPRVYPLRNDFCRVVNKTFDKMHRQGRLNFTTNCSPFSFPVFVVRKPNGNGKKKSRVVVDIKKLNEMILPNSYALLF